jgi:hypothetical protein
VGYHSKMSLRVANPGLIYRFNIPTETGRTHDSYQAYRKDLFKNEAYDVCDNVFNNDRLIKIM